MFTGLNAFPLTPFKDDRIDEHSYAKLIQRLVAAGVDAITAIGSTGSGVYLSTEERAVAARIAVENAGNTPVIVGVSALRTSQVLDNISHAEDAGASGLLLAPVTYQPLTHDDVFELFRTVTESTALPIIVYDNPVTTHFGFTNELYGRIAALRGIASIKIPAIPGNPADARKHVASIRAVVPEHVTIGISGDATAAAGLNAGCDAWNSVIGGTLPEPALEITRAALRGDAAAASAASERLTPLWELFSEYGGSLRVVAAIAEHLGLVPERSLPLPIQGLPDFHRAQVRKALEVLDLST